MVLKQNLGVAGSGRNLLRQLELCVAIKRAQFSNRAKWWLEFWIDFNLADAEISQFGRSEIEKEL